LSGPRFRGRRVDIGGRSLRMVVEGPSPQAVERGPLVVLEHGAFGCAADWASVQEKLAAKGFRSLAYERAGLGYSDPGPRPRDGRALVTDLSALLAASGEAGPYIVVGHSMGGLPARLFALGHSDKVEGLVLVDAVTPEVTARPTGLRAVLAYGRTMALVGALGRFGLMRPVSLLMGNLIGLTGEAALEKRRIYGSGEHAYWASVEVAGWPAAAEQASAALSPDLPVAVVTARSAQGREAWKAVQSAPALTSRHGYVEHVAGANHASLLGGLYNDAIVRGVEHVAQAVSPVPA
jgi:pimeloyl-ACP methyl ester carboxylesterase